LLYFVQFVGCFNRLTIRDKKVVGVFVRFFVRRFIVMLGWKRVLCR
jgi:hypothetical protein